jgi:hypothetical protein
MSVQMIELEEVQMVDLIDDALEALVGGQLYSIQCVSAHCS